MGEIGKIVQRPPLKIIIFSRRSDIGRVGGWKGGKRKREGVRVPSMGINGLPFKLGPGRGRGRRADDENESVTSCARVETGGRLSLSLSLRGGIGVKPPAG